MKRKIILARVSVCIACLILLNGCVAIYSHNLEEELSSTTEPTTTCQYHWAQPKLFLQTEKIKNWGYTHGSPLASGYTSLDSYVHSLLENCNDDSVNETLESKLSAYYLILGNRVWITNDPVTSFPVAILSASTLHLLPTPSKKHYAVCLEMTTSGGDKKIAIAKGSINVFGNAWGKGAIGDTDQKFIGNENELMRDITLQAWQKLWMSNDDEINKTPSCENRIKAIAKA